MKNRLKQIDIMRKHFFFKYWGKKYPSTYCYSDNIKNILGHSRSQKNGHTKTHIEERLSMKYLKRGKKKRNI